MNSSSSFGSKIGLSIARAKGGIERFGEFHNHPMPQFWTVASGHVRGVTGPLNFYTSTDAGTVLLDGTFSQNGNLLSRESGTHTFNTVTSRYIFADGTIAGWRAGSGSNNTSIIVSKSQFVSDQHLFMQRGNITLENDQQELTNVGSSLTFEEGRTVRLSLTSIPATFPPATAAYTLRHIRQSQVGQTSTNAVMINIDPPLEIEEGDQIRIESYEYTFSHSVSAPTTFEISPIPGLSGSGSGQRLRPITTNDSSITPTRVWFISDSDKISLPNILPPGTPTTHPNTLTPLQTFVATSSNINTASPANDMTQGSTITISVTGGEPAVKQIIWGTTSELIGVIEFDEPVSIVTDSTLTVGLSTKLEPVVHLPSVIIS